MSKELMNLAPHEWLLYIMHGGGVEISKNESVRDDFGRIVGTIVTSEVHFPTLRERMEAARIAAPFFASKSLRPKQDPKLLQSALENLCLLPQVEEMFNETNDR